MPQSESFSPAKGEVVQSVLDGSTQKRCTTKSVSMREGVEDSEKFDTELPTYAVYTADMWVLRRVQKVKASL